MVELAKPDVEVAIGALVVTRTRTVFYCRCRSSDRRVDETAKHGEVFNTESLHLLKGQCAPLLKRLAQRTANLLRLIAGGQLP